MTVRLEIWAFFLAGLLLTMSLGMLGYQAIHKQQVIADAIKAGADPIAVRCALDGPGLSGSSAECALAALRGGAK